MSKNSHMRSHLAYLAARLMAENGIQDYGTAKRKAARQAGVPDTRELPDNQEIETALRDYQALYQADEQPEILRDLREIAIEAMEFFAEFNPQLVGSVLTGTATRHSDINLQLFTDTSKEFEIFLLNRNVSYESGEKNFRLADKPTLIPVYRLDFNDVDVSVAVFGTDDLRLMKKSKADGSKIERARLAEVKALLDGMPESRMDT